MTSPLDDVLYELTRMRLNDNPPALADLQEKLEATRINVNTVQIAAKKSELSVRLRGRRAERNPTETTSSNKSDRIKT